MQLGFKFLFVREGGVVDEGFGLRRQFGEVVAQAAVFYEVGEHWLLEVVFVGEGLDLV